MLEDFTSINTFYRFSLWASTIFSFMAAVSGLLFLLRKSFFKPLLKWLVAIFSLFAGIMGILAITCDYQLGKLDLIKKRTPPLIDVHLLDTAPNKLIVYIECHNYIPFECIYSLRTRNERIVGVIFTEWIKIYPSEGKQKYSLTAKIHFDIIEEDYLKLRFDYRSIYAAEIGDPKLSGTIEKEYKLCQGIPIPMNQLAK